MASISIKDYKDCSFDAFLKNGSLSIATMERDETVEGRPNTCNWYANLDRKNTAKFFEALTPGESEEEGLRALTDWFMETTVTFSLEFDNFCVEKHICFDYSN